MNDKKLTIVMYHYVRDLKNSRFPGIKGLDTTLFKEQVEYMQKHYHFVSVEQVICAHNNGTALPEHAILLTFDDAYTDHFTNVFPILKKKGIQGAFFPPVKAVTKHTVLDVNKIHFILASTKEENLPKLLNEIKILLDRYRDEYTLLPFDDYLNKLAVADHLDCKEVTFVKRLLQVNLDERLRKIITDILFQKTVDMDEAAFSRELYMSIDQIKCMVNSGMHIGSHGYDHYWLGSLPKDKQEFEIKESVKFIDEIGGDVNNWTICYPYGNYNEDTISLLKKYNCQLGFTTNVDVASIDRQVADKRFKLSRIDTNDLPKERNAATNIWFDKG